MKTRKTLKALLIHLLNISMLISPMPLLASTETIENNSEWVGEIGGILNQVGGQIMQAKQQEFQLRQQAALMRNATPQLVPAKFFPQCRISPAGATIPQVCQPNPNPQAAVSEARAYKRMAQQQIDFYDQLLDEAQNSPLPSGIACLKLAKDGVASSIKDRMNGLERLKQQIAKANQVFEEQNQAILEDIKRNGNELLGIGRGRKVDVNQESADYNGLVTPECRDLIVAGFGGGSDFNDIIARNGLKGIRNGNLSKLNVSASQFSANKGSYERDLNQKVQQIKADIRKFGVEGFLDINSSSLSFERNGQQTFGSLNKAFSDFRNERAREVQNIRSSIVQEIGNSVDIQNLTRMDQNFQADFGEFVSQAEQQLKRQEITECVSGPVGLSTDQILGSLRYDSTSMTGDTITNYRNALQVILDNSDASAIEKQSEIERLDKKFKGRIRIVYNDEESIQRNESPYQMFQKIVQKCEQVFEQETDANVGRSTKKKIARAKKYMQDLQRIERTFASDLTNQLIDEVVNCSGRKLKAGQCGPDALSTDSDSFCLSQASDCAAQANACYGKIDGEVKVRQNNMNTLATRYNNNVAALITQQEALLNQIKSQVTRDAEFFKGLFPGATYDVPEDLFVEMPKLGDFQGLGVDLRGGGDIEVLKNLPGKIDKLKEQLQAQWSGGNGNKGIESVIEEYIALQRGAMEKNRDKWTDIQDNCVNSEVAALDAIKQANDAAKAAYGERKENLDNFCQRFDDLRDNPMAGCNDDYDVKGLHDDGMKVAAHINDDALRYVGTYKSLCAQAQNEKDRKEEDDEEEGTTEDMLKNACESGGSSLALSRMKRKVSEYGDGTIDIAKIDAVDSYNDLDAKTKTALSKNEGLETLVANYIAFKKSNAGMEEKIQALQTKIDAIEDPGNAASDATAGDLANHKKAEDKYAMARAAKSALSKLEDKGFCDEKNVNDIESAFNSSASASAFSSSYTQAVPNTTSMRSVGRAIASLELADKRAQEKAVQDPLSAMGQSKYADIECAATASTGRFSDIFKSFDDNVLGGDSSSILGIGK